jgi:hypothetical protein
MCVRSVTLDFLLTLNQRRLQSSTPRKNTLETYFKRKIAKKSFCVLKRLLSLGRRLMTFEGRRCKQSCQIFVPKIPNLGKFCRAFGDEDIGIFYGHWVYLLPFGYFMALWLYVFYSNMVYFTTLCYMLLKFGIIFGILVYSPMVIPMAF